VEGAGTVEVMLEVVVAVTVTAAAGTRVLEPAIKTRSIRFNDATATAAAAAAAASITATFTNLGCLRWRGQNCTSICVCVVDSGEVSG